MRHIKDFRCIKCMHLSLSSHSRDGLENAESPRRSSSCAEKVKISLSPRSCAPMPVHPHLRPSIGRSRLNEEVDPDVPFSDQEMEWERRPLASRLVPMQRHAPSRTHHPAARADVEDETTSQHHLDNEVSLENSGDDLGPRLTFYDSAIAQRRRYQVRHQPTVQTS